MSAVMVSTFSILDQDKFGKYLNKTQKVASIFGAELLFSGVRNRNLAGRSEDERVVIVKFPSVQALNRWFDSDEYQQLVPLREEAAEMTMISYE